MAKIWKSKLEIELRHSLLYLLCDSKISTTLHSAAPKLVAFYHERLWRHTDDILHLNCNTKYFAFFPICFLCKPSLYSGISVALYLIIFGFPFNITGNCYHIGLRALSNFNSEDFDLTFLHFFWILDFNININAK